MRIYCSYRDCLGLDKIDRQYHVQNMSQANIQYLPQWRALGNQGDLPTGWTPSSAGAGNTPNAVTDPIALAKQAQQMQIEANQPAIQTLNTQKSTLDTKYDDLLKSITGSESVASDKQTLATSSELAKRGITSDSGIAQQQQASAQLPVSTQFGQLKANTGLSREQDLTGLAAKIAGLQSGNVPASLDFSTGVGNIQNQAQQIANQFTIGQQQNRYTPLGYGGVYDTQTGQTIDSTKPQSIGAGGIYDPVTGQVISGIKAAQNSTNNNAGW